MNLLIIGSIALDSIKTPFGEKKEILGGSAVHSAIAASFFTDTVLFGPVGKDFPQEHLDFLKKQSINLDYLQLLNGQTFRWEGFYEYDMNQAHTLSTALNVLEKFIPKLPEALKKTPYIFLANLDPEIQLKLIEQFEAPKVIALDTMNFWINNKRSALDEVIKKVDFVLMNDAELRQFMQTPSIPVAAQRIIELGAKALIIKKGEHGALFFSDSTFFSAPSYPQNQLRDPTGAGDSFAGGFMGYLAKTNDFSSENIRRAVVMGSVMASFNVEDFSCDRLRYLKHKEVFQRFDEFRSFTFFEALPLHHWV